MMVSADVTTMKRLTLRKALAAAALAGLLASCETAPQVRTQSAPGLNLELYTTYNYVKQPSTDRGNYRSLTTRDLEDAVDRQMQARGYTKSDHPALLINFRTTVRDKVQGSWGPGWGWGYGWGYGWGPGWGPGWGGPGWGPGWWGPGPWGYGGWGDIDTYSEGTLTIDVIDAKTHDAIWSGSAASYITREALAHPRVSIDQNVAAIFSKFPRPAIQGGQTH